jgi:hypothetical protein
LPIPSRLAVASFPRHPFLYIIGVATGAAGAVHRGMMKRPHKRVSWPPLVLLVHVRGEIGL